jgi:cell division GTPase FtsZ
MGASQADEEIRRIADSLSVCIKIVGCGGGGCNTVNRCMEANITGAQLCAINTDAGDHRAAWVNVDAGLSPPGLTP